MTIFIAITVYTYSIVYIYFTHIIIRLYFIYSQFLILNKFYTLEHHTTTTMYRPGKAQIEILEKNRQLTNKTFFGQLDGLNDKVLELNGQLNLLVQFVFAIKDKETGELWRCDIMRCRPRKQFFIVS